MSVSQVVTRNPDRSNPRWLGEVGHVNGLKYGYVYPGGCDAASWNLLRAANYRADSMNVGRIVEIYRGTSRVWYGKLNEPASSATGWVMSAHGAGTLGTDYLAGSGTLAPWTSGNWTLNGPITQAMSRGLEWNNVGGNAIPNTAFLPLLANAPDNWSGTVTDFLASVTEQAGLAWYIDRFNNLVVGPIPATPNRILVCTDPASRTIIADINRLYIKYTVSDDGQGNTVTAFATAANAQSVAQHDPIEAPIDLTSAGVISSGQAVTYGNNILGQYTRANYSSSFTVRHGQLLTMGGTAIDLGTEQAAMVCRLILMDAGYGGEVVPGPVTFPVGAYEYDDDTDTGSVTPFQSYKTDLGSLLSVMIPALRQ